jgi:hypothetical protein
MTILATTSEVHVGRAIIRVKANYNSVHEADDIAPGHIRYGGAGEYYGTSSFAVDVDGDGAQEVVTGNALYRDDGSTIWFNGERDGYVATADFDGDGDAEIVVTGYGEVRLQDTDGSVLWLTAIPGALGAFGGPPTVADFDGDGAPEIGVAGNSTYTVLDTDGSVLWQNTVQDGSSGATGSAVFDFEGDGIAEVVYADETRLWAFAGPDGAVKLESTDHSSWTVVEYPVVADVDHDDQAEIVVAHSTLPGDPTPVLGISVIGDADRSWRPSRRIWNQYAYDITNVDDDGRIPATPDPNWLTYNNFRSGDIEAGSGLSSPDATLAQADLCEIDCAEDRLVLWVNPGNEGAANLAAGATIGLYATILGVETLLDEQIASAIPAGWYADSLTFDLQGRDPATFDAIVLRITPTELDCDDANNELRWEGPFCASP